MSKLYAAEVDVYIDGNLRGDIKRISEKGFTKRVEVKAGKTTGSAPVTPSYGVNLDYVIPGDAPEYDWEALTDSRLTIEYPSGARITYTGVAFMEMGDTEIDFEKEVIRAITLSATGRIKE